MIWRVRVDFFGALLVVEDLALALFVGARQADAGVERGHVRARATAVLGALCGDLFFFDLALVCLLLLGLLLARFEFGVDLGLGHGLWPPARWPRA